MCRCVCEMGDAKTYLWAENKQVDEERLLIYGRGVGN